MHIQKFASWLLYQKMGWTKHVTIPFPDKFIICLAPHTSNWDFALGQLFTWSEGIKINFLMKREWFFWPLGILFRRLGGIPVWRSKHSSMTPEGTRSPNADWKKGFYYIALGAKIPILLYGVDYEKKQIVCTQTFIPSGDIEHDMPLIKDYFKSFKGKKPENFAY